MFEALYRRVLEPLLTGSDLRIERPFGETAKHMQADVPQSGRELIVRKLRQFAAIDSLDEQPIDNDIIVMAAAMHDLIAAFHPALKGAFRADAPLALIDYASQALSLVRPPQTLRSALMRHVWLGSIVGYSLVRSDVHWWVGSDSFVGKEPPARLFLWPELRRVRRADRTASVVALAELFSDRQDLGALEVSYNEAIDRFFCATPLTDLFYAARRTPVFSWRPVHEQLLATEPASALTCRVIAANKDGGRAAAQAIASASNYAFKPSFDPTLHGVSNGA